MDKVFRQGRERKSLKPQATFMGNGFQLFVHWLIVNIPANRLAWHSLQISCSGQGPPRLFCGICHRIRLILICSALIKNWFINTCDIPIRGNRWAIKRKVRNRKKFEKVEKVDVFKLSKSEKAHLLKEAKENLRQTLVEAKFFRTLAETERVTINGYKSDFKSGGLTGLTYDELAEPWLKPSNIKL